MEALAAMLQENAPFAVMLLLVVIVLRSDIHRLAERLARIEGILEKDRSAGQTGKTNSP